MRASAWWLGLGLGLGVALLVALVLLRGEPREEGATAFAAPAPRGDARGPVHAEEPAGTQRSALVPLVPPAAPAPQPLDVDPEPEAHRGVARLRLLDEDGRPWHGGRTKLAVMPADAESPAPAQLPLAALDEVTWSDASVAGDGCVVLAIPAGRSSRVQAFSASSRSAPTLVPHGAAVTVAMRPVTQLSGRVLDAGGQPLAGAWVLLHAATRRDLTRRWSVGKPGIDRRMSVPPRDPAIVLTDANGRFRLPHAQGLLVAEHPDALTALAWVGPEGADITLGEGHVLEADIVDADGRRPAPGRGLVVSVSEGGEGVDVQQQPYLVQLLDPGPRFHVRASGMTAPMAFAVLEDAQGTRLDTQGARFDATGHGHVVLHAQAAASVVVRIPESHALLARVELHRVKEPAPGGSSEKQLRLQRSTDIDAWQGGVPWTGPTDVVIASEQAGTYVLTRVVIDEAHESFDLRLPATRLVVRVVAGADAFPADLIVRRPEVTDISRQIVCQSRVERSGQDTLIEHLLPGTFLVQAGASSESARADGSTFALDTVLVTEEVEARLMLEDRSRLLEVAVVDEQRRPCEAIAVFVDSDASSVDLLAGIRTDAAGRGSLRLAGSGPFKVWAYDQDGERGISGSQHGIRADAGPLTIVLHRVATVTFQLGRVADGAAPTARLRVASAAGLSGFDAEVEVEDGRSTWPLRLPSGRWSVDLLDAAGRVLARREADIGDTAEQTVRLDG